MSTLQSPSPYARHLHAQSRRLVSLLASMRFAIAILVVVAVAACIGSIAPQGQPVPAYLNRYGEVWGHVFLLCGLDDVYHAPWFLSLVALLALSTAVCVARNAPGMVRQMFSFQSHVNRRYVENLPHSVRLGWLATGDAPEDAIRTQLKRQGYALRRVALRTEPGTSLFAARKGGMRRAGYLLTHGAIVLICIAALGNSDFFVRARLLLGLQHVETRDLPISQVPPASVLPPSTPAFRAQVSVAEHDSAHAALIQFGDGYLVQPLPFNLRVRQFHIEYYPNGQPSDFVSDIELTDRDGTHPRDYLLRVNHPVTDHGITLFQSGFEDGGTQVGFKVKTLTGEDTTVDAHVGQATPILIDGKPWLIEPNTFTRVNVQQHRDNAKAALVTRFLDNDGVTKRDLGPSIATTILDMSGQSIDWLAFVNPVEIGGSHYRALGVRRAGQADYDFIKIPVDASGDTHTFDTLAHRLNDPQLRAHAAATLDASGNNAAGHATGALLDVFASRGYGGIDAVLQHSVPQQDRARAAELFMGLLNEAVAQMMNDTLSGPHDATTLADAMQAYSDIRRLNVNVLPVPMHYQQRNASGLQVTRQWGGGIVVACFVLLALGVCLLYFVAERRAWVILEEDGRHVQIALAANRPTPTLSAELDELVQHLLGGKPLALRRKQ